MDCLKFFAVNVSKYDAGKNHEVYRPASVDHPKDNAVMFFIEGYVELAAVMKNCRECLVFWPKNVEVPQFLEEHAVCLSEKPHTAFCEFFKENRITILPMPGPCEMVNGAWIEKGAVIGERCTIFPGAYIGAEVRIGDDVYIGCGVKLVGRVRIGNRVVIRENTVVGADGLTTDREEDGSAVTMPQFGEVVLEDDVWIASNVTIARGAIDETRIGKGSKIGCGTFVSHNVHIGEHTFIVGESMLFGSVTIGDRVLISGNSTMINRVTVKDGAVVGPASVVMTDVPEGKSVFGNPARIIKR